MAHPVKRRIEKPDAPFPYTYWEKRRHGFRLDYRRRAHGTETGFNYLYLGFWSFEDLEQIEARTESKEEFNDCIRYQANENAKAYIARKVAKEARASLPRSYDTGGLSAGHG